MSSGHRFPPRPRPYILHPGQRPDFSGPEIHLAERRDLGTTGAMPGHLFCEGEIYEGAFSLSGNAGPHLRWIVVAPWGKAHIHAVDPAQFRCWPLEALARALDSGRAQAAGFEPDHPIVRLQRAKERAGLRDTHLRLDSSRIETMLSLLEEAQATGADYVPYAAAEIRNQLTFSLLDERAHATIVARVDSIVAPLVR